VSHRPALTYREVSWFFFPLLLNVQLMSVSHSVINAALARQQDFITALAAFSVAMVLHLFLASPSYQNHTITIAMVNGRKSLRGTVLFVLLVATFVSLALALIAFTAIGDFVLQRLLGVTGEVAEGAREVLGILVFLPFFTGFRGLFQGLVIRARRTGLVSFATGVRIAVLLLLLSFGSRWYVGPALGAFALLGCIVIETILMAFFASRCPLPEQQGEERGTWEILRFAYPLAYSSCLQQTIPLLINAIISRLPDGPLALASFGVIRGFLFLLAGPMRNLQQAYLTLVRDEAGYAVLVRFARRVALGMGVLMLLAAFPLNTLVLGGIMGIEETMRAYITLPLAACAIFPLLYGTANLLRGYFTGQHRTHLLGGATFIKVFYLLACWGILLLFPLLVPGVALAIFLLISSELCEIWYLHYRRRRTTRP
jgi:progressive ankylosis protein